MKGVETSSPGASASRHGLRQVLGSLTVVCVGVGAAIGSGVFRAPGEVAELVQSPWIILLLWIVAGLITFFQCLVTAELATRFPHAGGEYQYLKAAYGEFAAFFFGWCFTIFIIGAGAGSIAAALGGFACSLFGVDEEPGRGLFGCAAIIGVTVVNCLGLRAGALAQNLMTIIKTVALLGIAVGAILAADRLTPAPSSQSVSWSTISGWTLLTAMIQAFWPYTGATDSAKLAEEVRDVHRALPRALLMSVMLLAVVYCVYNYALLCAIPPHEMAGKTSVQIMPFNGLGIPGVRELILGISVIVCLGAISSVFLANVRVTYALARDGLTFSFLARMSNRQSPIGSFVVCGAIACTFVMMRDFGEIVSIYFLGAAVLFALTYISAIVFRLRDRAANRPFPTTAFKTPLGYVVVGLLVIIQGLIAASIIRNDALNNRADSLMSIGLLLAMAVFYLVWRSLYSRPAQRRS